MFVFEPKWSVKEVPSLNLVCFAEIISNSLDSIEFDELIVSSFIDRHTPFDPSCILKEAKRYLKIVSYTFMATSNSSIDRLINN